MRRFGYFIVGAAMGGIVCGVMALLFTPNSGQQLRKQISETSQKIKQDLQQAAVQRRIELEQQLANLRASNAD